ncbi:MAG: 3-phosphoshikimate 1-carboxyvinyltransferase, partial [Eggerthellaceae bacterium]|nr:3-phosphoshikimate 1-carboxyvinyltransferase [Eggerthellaceae bacterium]
MNALHLQPSGGPLDGSIMVPGDKSISHRAILFGAMSSGTTRVSGMLDSADVRSSIRVIQQLGARVNLEKMPDGSLAGGIEGWGEAGPSVSHEPLDCGNSGTTARLIMGMLAGYDIEATITGDDSLQSRPMVRVMTPLKKMGARFSPLDATTLPLTVHGSSKLKAIRYATPVASAQVKSAILLAGVHAKGTTQVQEPAPSRNHTELMLPRFGVSTLAVDGVAHVTGPVVSQSAEISVPGDPSSAAFLLSAAALTPGSAIQVEHVSLNPGRVGFLRVLENMGVDASRRSDTTLGKELVGVMSARYCSNLHGVAIASEKMPSLIDEVPILSLVAAHAHGITVFKDVSELRVKETDRVASIIEGLEILGV